MTWIPHFLNWQLAAGVAAAAIPALLVLYFLKLRRKEMPVSSTILWRKAIQDLQVNAPFQRLRRNLLLLLQLILLLLLLLALSRPVSNYTPGPGKTTVILIDRSASMACRDMAGHTRLEEAKKRAKDLVAGMKRGATAMVIAFDDSAEMVQPFTSDQNLLRSAIDSVVQTDRKTDLKLAYQLAEAQVNFNPEQLRSNTEPPDVRLYSDGRVLNEAELRIKGNVTYEKLGDDKSANIGIVALSAKRNYERPTEVQVFARLANFGPEPVSTGVQLSLDDERIDAETAKFQDTFLLPERWTEPERAKYEETSGQKRTEGGVQFKFELARAAVIKVEQTHKEGDVLAADDTASIVVPPPKTLSVCLVTDNNYFLERAIRSLNLNKPQVLRPEQYEEKYKDKPPTDFDVIVFDRYVPPADPKTHKTPLPEAGNFIWIDEVPEGIKTKVATYNAAPSTKPGGAGAAAAAPAAPAGGKPGEPIVLNEVGVLDWKRDHPILQNLALNKLYATEALKLDVPLDKEVLVDGLKGPLIVLDREDKRTHLILGFNLLDSNWPLKVSFPVFLDNALQFLAVGSEMSVRESYAPGATPRIPRANLLRVGEGINKITLEGPTGRRSVNVPPAGDFVLPALDKVGVYTTSPPIPQYETLAVNLLDANESNVLPSPHPPGDIGRVEATGAAKSRLELWWWLALAAGVFLFIEWWVYTRRVHL